MLGLSANPGVYAHLPWWLIAVATVVAFACGATAWLGRTLSFKPMVVGASQRHTSQSFDINQALVAKEAV
jgi:hypothetical protein